MTRRTRLRRGGALAPLAVGALLVACGTTSAKPSPSRSGGTMISAPTASPSTSASSSATSSPAAPAPTPIAGFMAASVTFVSSNDGWVLGTVGSSLAVARTQDGGAQWTSITPPPTGFYSGSSTSGVSGIRFADQQDGWAFGSQLWATHNGGTSWTQVTLPGLGSGGGMTPIQDVETAAGEVYAVYFGSSGFSLASSPTASNSWVTSSTGISFGAGPIPTAQLVVQGSSAWVLENDRTVVGGARYQSGAWSSWTPACSTVGGSAALAASSTTNLLAICDVGAWTSGPPVENAFTSGNGGTGFTQLSTALPAVCQGSDTVGSPSTAIAAAGCGAQIVATSNSGGSWATVFTGSSNTSISFVGFENTSQGVAIEASLASSTGLLLMTHNGGSSWAVVTI
jgi:hypothetical protein